MSNDTETLKSNKQVLRKKLTHVALPIALQSLISSSLNLVDTIMVGSLGEVELATLGLATQVSFIFWMILFGFTGGTITYMAQFWGKRDLKNIRRVTGISVTSCFAVGLVFFIFSFFFPELVLRIFTNIPEVIEMGRDWVHYASFIFLIWSVVVPLTALLKATQQTSIPLKISIVVFVTNTLLGLILIFGLLGAPRLGIMGACVGLIVSRFLELVIYIYVIFIKKNIVAGPIKEFFSWNKDLFQRIFRNTIPTTINEVMWALGTSMYNAAYGRIGITAFAAVQAGNTILNLFALACFSVGEALLIIVGEKLGAGEIKEADKSASYILKLTIIIGLIAGTVLFITSRFIVKLFDLSDTGVQYALLILAVYSGAFVFKIVNSAILTGILRAGGDTKFAMIAEIICVWGIGVPLAFIFALYVGLPVYLVVLIVQTEEFVKIFIVMYRFRSKKWLRNLVKNIE